MRAFGCIAVLAVITFGASGCAGSRSVSAPSTSTGRASARAVTARGMRAGVSPVPVTEVPSSLPTGGAQLHNPHIFLQPWASAPSGVMSAEQAIAVALVFANKPSGSPATALQAEMSMPGENPPRPSVAARYAKHHQRVWIVTFTSPKPVDVSAGMAPVYATHYSVAVDAATGKFVLGFFER